MRLIRTLVVTGSAALAAGALTVSVASTAAPAASGRSARTATRATSAHFQARARMALIKYLKHSRPLAMVAPHTRLEAGAGADAVVKKASYNWSGYARTSATVNAFTSVSAKWTQPKVTCSREDQMSGTWVGMDGTGATNPTVEQDGTTAWCYEGKAIYYTWYEMFPGNSVEVGKTLKAGDKITASVTRSGSSYKLKLTDATHSRASFTKTLACKKVHGQVPCKAESIEWIQERPDYQQTGLLPLAHYGSWKVTSVTGASKGTTLSFTMVDTLDNYVLSSVGSLSKGTFTAKFHDSY